MKLLFDQNLSRRLVGMLATEYSGSQQVDLVGLSGASDADVWHYAEQHHFIIVSKDSDFRHLALLYGPRRK